MLDFQLSPQQLKLQQKAREFALKEILPVAWYCDEIDETPMEVLKKGHAAGGMSLLLFSRIGFQKGLTNR